MYYCEVTPRNNRGIVHLKTVVFLKNYNLEFDRDSKLLYFIDCISGESVQISPLYEYKLVEDSKNRSRNCYEFKVALKVLDDFIINHKEVNLSNSKDFEKEGCDLEVSQNKDLIKLLYLDNKGHNILKGFNKGKRALKETKFSYSDDLVWTKFQIDCRDLIILEDNILSIDIRSCEGIFCLIFRIGIKIDTKLNFLDLKVASLSCLSGIESLKATKDLVIGCKNCGIELEYLSDFNLYSLPSDLYLNSIGSIYCEECQDDLSNSKSDSKEFKLSHKHNILYISDESITVNHSLGSKHAFIASNKDCNNNNSHFDNCIEEDKEVYCNSCKQIIGCLTNKSISYFKNRVFGISEGVDLFWRHSKFIDFIEKIQFSEKINLNFRCGLENIQIIKVTREPDTFIFNTNNPVLTTRILYKIDIFNNSNSNIIITKDNNINTKEIFEELDIKLFDHIKHLILLFSHDKDNTDWIPSLLPQI